MKDASGITYTARHKGVAVLTAVALASAPLVWGTSAYGQGVAASSDAIASCPEAARGLIEGYASGSLSSDGLVSSLRSLADEGAITADELDAMLALLGSGALDPAPDPSDEVQPAVPDAGEPSVPDVVEPPAPDPDEPSVPDVVEPEVPDGEEPADPDEGTAPDDGVNPDESVNPDDDAADDPSEDGSKDEVVEPSDPSGSGDEPSDKKPGSDGDAGKKQPAVEPVGPTDAHDAFAAPSSNGAAPAVEVTPSSGTYTPRHYSHNLTTEKFIAVVGEQARQVGQERDIYASVMIAQAILESASGNSKLAQAPNNNLFGIKGSWEGKSVSMRTMEDDGSGLYFAILANFRAYDSITDSLEDYADLLTDDMGAYYQGAWKSNAKTPAQACDFLQGRYATSTSYSASLQDLIETYDLTRFDEPLDYETVETYELPAVDEETGKALLDEEGEPVMEERVLADLLAEATSHLGTEYVWGGADPETGFDCSGLMQYAYKEALGVNLPRTTYQQWKQGTTVSFDDLHMGDLLFFERDGDVHHVAMYLGDGYYIQAPQRGDVVKVTSMEEYMPSFAQRIVETRPVEDEEAAEALVDGEVAADAETAVAGSEGELA